MSTAIQFTRTTSIHGQEVTIRPLVEKDLAALEWNGEFTHFRRVYTQHYHNTANGTTLIWVVETGDREIIGQLFLLLLSQQREIADGVNRAYIFSFRIKPKYRNQGLGTSLLVMAEDELRKRGFRQVRLNVAKDNSAARRLYERLGYRVIGNDQGVWNYQDHNGDWQTVREPAWKMIKDISDREKPKKKLTW